MTRVILDLDPAGHRDAWYRLEAAKRRLLYTLHRLPDADRQTIPAGARIELVADRRMHHPRVLTGHDNGVITVNIAEADDAERERRRIELNEPYRTLLGHFRHETGHYYWDRLIRDGSRSRRSVRSFGDERADYAAVPPRPTTTRGRPPDWQATFVTAYAAHAPVGRLGRDVGALPAHDRHARDRSGLRRLAAARRADEPALSRRRPTRHAEPSFDAMIDELVSADLRAEQLESRARHAGRLPVRPVRPGDREAAVRARDRRDGRDLSNLGTVHSSTSKLSAVNSLQLELS